MHKYNVLYFSSGYSSIHAQIIKCLRENRNNVTPCLYTLHFMKQMFSYPKDAIIYSSGSKMRGFLFWKKRLDAIADHYSKKVNWDQVDILHSHLLYTDGYICRKLSYKHNKPYIVTVRNTDIYTKYLRLPHIHKEMIKTVESASAIICLSDNYKKTFIERIREGDLVKISNKIHIITNGLDQFWINNSNRKKRIINHKLIKVLTVGRIEKNKNQEGVIRAIRLLRNNGYKIEYIMVGDCIDKEVKRIADNEEWIRAVKFQKKEKLIKYYREADIFAMTSFKETFGLVYLEALSQGLPIIYSKGQGFDGQFNEGEVGFHADSEDVFSIASALKSVINNYEKLSERCIGAVNKYAWQNIAQMFDNVYRNSINEYNHII